MGISIFSLNSKPERLGELAQWFHKRFSVPLEAYTESMEQALRDCASTPRWYFALDGDRIVAGAGVIENDFHKRPDLRPNVCAVYVEKDYRLRGLARQLLCHICDDMAQRGEHTLYLLTGHTEFYERCGWDFLCMAECDGGETSRVYVRTTGAE